MVGQQLARLTLNGDRVVNEETLAQQMGRIRDVRQSPECYIYLVTDDREGKATPILRLELTEGAGQVAAQRERGVATWLFSFHFLLRT